MFFEQPNDIPRIAKKVSCAVFVLPKSHFASEKINSYFKNAKILQPNDNNVTPLISVEALREFISHTNNISTSEQFLVIAHADAMNEPAQNAFLKTFEEPKNNYHFVLFTDEPGALLSTIRSRAQIFYLKTTDKIDNPPPFDAEIMAIAKKLVTADATGLPSIAEELAKTKTKPREKSLQVVAAAIEILYKSYFKTGNEKFLAKVPNFLKLYDNLKDNGHIKLHIVADLL